jgi:DNA polymerase III subunit epsilon
MTPTLLAVLPGLAAAALATGAALWWVIRRTRVPADVPLRDLAFVAVDTETTGLDPRRDALVALAAIPFAAGVAGPPAFSGLVNPGRAIPDGARAIHGIGDAEVRDAPLAEVVLPGFLGACRDRVLVAHTAGFDLTLINRAAKRAGLPPLDGPVLDVGALAHGVFPSWWDLSLEGLARLTEVEPVGRHTAEGDAVTAGTIFLKLVPLLEQHGVCTLAAALRLQRRTALIPTGPGATGGGLVGP